MFGLVIIWAKMYQNLAKHALVLGLTDGPCLKCLKYCFIGSCLDRFWKKVEKFQTPSLTLSAMGTKNMTWWAPGPPVGNRVKKKYLDFICILLKLPFI